jgi:3-oxoadipate enol-lactonase
MAEMKIGAEIFNVVVEGPDDAPALLISNSLGTTLHMWDGQMPVLSKSFRVIRYDSRGHGGSVAGDGPYSIEQLGQDALNILDALGIETANYLGLSMGGMVGMWLLTHHGHRINRAVLANTGAFMGGPELWNMRIRTARSEGMNGLVNGTIERWFTREFQEKSPEAVEKITQQLKSTPPLGYASSCAAIRDMDQREAIRSITRPVLVIVGTKDPATPPAMGGLIAGSIPGARLIDLDAAHLSNIEAEMAFNRAVVAFLTAETKREPAKPAAKKKYAAKKAAAKKSAAKKPNAKKTPAKKAAKKTAKKAVKKNAVKKSAAKKAGKKSAAKKSPAKKAATKKVSAKKGVSGKAAAKKTAVKKAAVKKAAKKPAGKAIKKTVAKPAKKAARKAAKKARR